MVLVVPCSNCGAKLSAPESAAGQRMRCPKCNTIAPIPTLVPAEEVPVVEAKLAPPPPKPKPVQAEVAEDDRPRKKKRRYADDDDDYEHDHPRRKPRRKSGGGSGGLVAGIVIGGMLVLAGVGFAVFFFWGGGKGTLFVKKAPVPAGWKRHNYPQDDFTVYLPNAPTHMNIPIGDRFAPVGWFGAGGRFGVGGFEAGDDVREAERLAVVTSGDRRSSTHVEVCVIKFRGRVPSSVRDQMRNLPNGQQFGGVEWRSVKWLGYDAVEKVSLNEVLRVVSTDRHLVLALIGGPNGTRAKPEEEAGFFDNIELTN